MASHLALSSGSSVAGLEPEEDILAGGTSLVEMEAPQFFTATQQ